MTGPQELILQTKTHFAIFTSMNWSRQKKLAIFRQEEETENYCAQVLSFEYRAH